MRPVLVPLLHLHCACELGYHGADVPGVVLERGVVVQGKTDPGTAGDASHEALAGVDREECRTKRLNPGLHRLLRAGAERDHGDHRPDADDDAQRGEQRANFVRPQRFEGDGDPLSVEDADPWSTRAGGRLWRWSVPPYEKRSTTTPRERPSLDLDALRGGGHLFRAL